MCFTLFGQGPRSKHEVVLLTMHDLGCGCMSPLALFNSLHIYF